MTGLSEKDKKEIARLLNDIEETVKDAKDKCKNDVQIDIINEVGKFLDKHRK
jgi:hypothetical protein